MNNDASSASAALKISGAGHPSLPGAPASAITPRLHFFNSVLDQAMIPTFRVLDGNGAVIKDAEVPEARR
jgi:2-oxoisovalerate dehydrogenase E1 component alpha subunit